MKTEAHINDQEKNEPFLALERDLGLPALKELLDLFKNTFPAKLGKIAKSLESKDYEPIYFETHQMVSSAANMGATTISGLIREFESVLKATDIPKAKEILEKVRSEFQNYISKAESYISSGSHQSPDLTV